MRGDRLLTNPREYERVYRQGISRVSSSLVLRAAPNNLDISRYGISVSRRVGKAVTRNYVKRRLREMLKLLVMKPGWDIVIVARTKSSLRSYWQLKEEVQYLLKCESIIDGFIDRRSE